MTKYKDFIPHTKYKYSISKYCNKNTILRKMFNSQIYKYILILWIIIESFSVQAQEMLSVPVYRKSIYSPQNYSEMKRSTDIDVHEINPLASNITIPIYKVNMWEH